MVTFFLVKEGEHRLADPAAMEALTRPETGCDANSLGTFNPIDVDARIAVQHHEVDRFCGLFHQPLKDGTRDHAQFYSLERQMPEFGKAKAQAEPSRVWIAADKAELLEGCEQPVDSARVPPDGGCDLAQRHLAGNPAQRQEEL